MLFLALFQYLTKFWKDQNLFSLYVCLCFWKVTEGWRCIIPHVSPGKIKSNKIPKANDSRTNNDVREQGNDLMRVASACLIV